MKKLKVLVLLHPSLIPPETTKKEELDFAPWRTEYHVIKTLKDLGHTVYPLGVESDLLVIRKAFDEFKPDIAFNLLEQFGGEAVFDHNVVSYLELLKLPYTGCNPKGLLLSRDKSLSKKILYYHRIKTPKFFVVKQNHTFKLPKNIDFPMIVKSKMDEGSVGISQSSVVNDLDKLTERVKFIHESVGSDAIVESFIEGDDIYISLMGNNKVSVFPILELDFKNVPDGMFKIATSRVKWNKEYQKKYSITVKETNKLDEEAKKKVIKLGKRIYKILGINGYARLDMRFASNGDVYFIEANPNPEISKGEEFSISASKVGIKYPQLIEKMLLNGLSWVPESIYY